MILQYHNIQGKQIQKTYFNLLFEILQLHFQLFNFNVEFYLKYFKSLILQDSMNLM
jgi:hypothetical protein